MFQFEGKGAGTPDERCEFGIGGREMRKSSGNVVARGTAAIDHNPPIVVPVTCRTGGRVCDASWSSGEVFRGGRRLVVPARPRSAIVDARKQLLAVVP